MTLNLRSWLLVICSQNWYKAISKIRQVLQNIYFCQLYFSKVLFNFFCIHLQVFLAPRKVCFDISFSLVSFCFSTQNQIICCIKQFPWYPLRVKGYYGNCFMQQMIWFRGYLHTPHVTILCSCRLVETFSRFLVLNVF